MARCVLIQWLDLCNRQWPSWQCVRRLATQHVVVSAEAAKAVSQHGQGLVQLPRDMLQTLEGALAEAGLSGKVSKLQALALTDRLKALSRSTAAGGLQPYRDHAAAAAAGVGGSSGWHQQQGCDASMTPEQLQEQQDMDAELEKMASALGPEQLEWFRATRAAAQAAAQLPLPRTRGGRLKTQARDAIEQHMAVHGVLGLPHEAVREALGLPPSSTLMSPARTEKLKAATPKYNTTQALAYACVRLPGCYAAAHRIFKELSVRYPGFEPRTLLDFGAGPGTASWAAQEVWRSSLSRVTAVEPSPAMSQLGRRLEAARRFTHPNPPMVRWRADLPPVALSGRRRAQQSTHNLVVASYVLGELTTPQERAALIRHLWGLTNDMLVLIEPGTPTGFANIHEARAGILDYEGRRQLKLQRRLAAASSTAADAADAAGNQGRGAVEGSDSGSAVSRGDHNLPLKAASKWFGAHVVAPCPHDAPCPLAAPGSKSWCHFGTRFQRPGFMQQAKAPPGSRANPADHQDERYSYVVLRRGARPAVTQHVDIRRTFAAAPSGRPSAAAATHGVDATSLTALEQLSSFSSTEGSGAVQQLGNHTADAGMTQHDNAIMSADELQQLAVMLPGGLVAAEQGRQPSLQQQQHQHDAKLGVYGAGFVNQLIAAEDAGVDWSSSGQSLMAFAPVTASQPAQSQLGGSSTAAQGLTVGPVGSTTQALPVSDDDMLHQLQPGTELQQPASNDLQEQYAHTSIASPAVQEGLPEAISNSALWSRIVRPPRRRGGHILLDVCALLSAPSGQAAIKRHVVAKSDAVKWMGKAGYELAKSANWGDLWPTAYDKNPKQQVVSK